MKIYRILWEGGNFCFPITAMEKSIFLAVFSKFGKQIDLKVVVCWVDILHIFRESQSVLSQSWVAPLVLSDLYLINMQGGHSWTCLICIHRTSCTFQRQAQYRDSPMGCNPSVALSISTFKVHQNHFQYLSNSTLESLYQFFNTSVYQCNQKYSKI